MDTLRVTKDMRLGCMLVLTSLLCWPDWSITDRFTWGFPIAGWIPASNIYPEARAAKEQLALTEILGGPAKEWNAKIANDTRPHETDAVILETTRSEQTEGKLSPDMSAEELDELFGVGGWRAIRRRSIWQEGKQKWRNIDNARTSRTNDATLLPDTIRTTPFDITVRIASAIREAVGAPLKGDLQIGVSSEDQQDAYHTIPTMVGQLGLAVIAFLDIQASPPVMRFAIAYGHIFGLRSAVTNYNRFPELVVAIARRCLGALCWHFFDDVGTMCAQKHVTPGTSIVPQVFEALGRSVSPKKAEPWSTMLLRGAGESG